MASLFKPTTVKPVPANAVIKTIGGKRHACWTNRKNKKVEAELTEDGKKCRVPGPTWWIEYTTAAGVRGRAKGFRDRGATLQLAASLERAAEDVRSGRESPRQASPDNLADHLSAFQEHLEARGNGAEHVASVMHNVRLVISSCGLTLPNTVNCDRVSNWLAAERKRREWSAENQNRYIKFLRQFGRWLVRSKRLISNPFEGVALVATDGQKSRSRRRLPDEEFGRLVRAARESKVSLLSIGGPDRARLYMLAAYTGFRITTLSKLTPERFTWSGPVPAMITAGARITKNKKPHTVPLHPAVGASLADWLRDLASGRPIFPPGNWSERGADLVAHDLITARVAWINEAVTPEDRAHREASTTLCPLDASGEVFDFHALRVQFISGLALAGVPLTAAQRLADHSTPNLTSNIYTRFSPTEMAEQVAKLPKPPLG